MKLLSIKYSQFDNTPREWDLDNLELGSQNLIVGKNASGKTKTLNLINNLARLLCGEIKPTFTSTNFDAQFEHDEKKYNYVINISDNSVDKEVFKLDNKILMSREDEGKGQIFAEQLNKDIDFQVPVSELAFLARRDSIQHKYFEPLYKWAKSVYSYAFGTSLGKDTLALPQTINTQLDHKNTSMVVAIYQKGLQEFKTKFSDMIKNDLAHIDYHITDIGIAPPSYITMIPPISNEILGIWIQEKELKSKTEQAEISQGMFRVISLLIQMNYSILALEPSCILIDDIGEGLDFHRSCSLIELLLSKTKDTNIQLIMSTNDRFVMNKVPLDKWIVLQREGSHCKVYNAKNSKKLFDDFKFTGLNNFDFFASDYFIEHKK